jgi:hypothetical protein
MSDGRADGEWAPFEQPVIANKNAATRTAPRRAGRSPQQRTVSIYATLAAMMERFGFCECCRP